MNVPRRVIDEYTRTLNALSSDVRRRLADELEKVDYSDIASARDAVIAIMEAFLGAYSGLAATVSAAFYETVREMQVGGEFAAIAESNRKPKATEEAVRGFMRFAVDGNVGQLVGACLQRADYEIKRAAGECTFANMARDPKKPRYARVASGRETCDWCLMLASRGFVYRSKEAAGAGNHYHADCDCRIVPSWGAGIEGYDPDALYRRWQEVVDDKARAASESRGTTFEEERERIFSGYANTSRNARKK
jgi:hypothetical protein